MSTFLWAVVVLAILSMLGRLVRFTKNDFTRTPTDEAINIVGDLILLVWAAVLIGKTMP